MVISRVSFLSFIPRERERERERELFALCIMHAMCSFRVHTSFVTRDFSSCLLVFLFFFFFFLFLKYLFLSFVYFNYTTSCSIFSLSFESPLFFKLYAFNFRFFWKFFPWLFSTAFFFRFSFSFERFVPWRTKMEGIHYACSPLLSIVLSRVVEPLRCSLLLSFPFLLRRVLSCITIFSQFVALLNYQRVIFFFI